MTKKQEERLVIAIELMAKTMANQAKQTKEAVKELSAVATNFIEKMNSI